MNASAPSLDCSDEVPAMVPDYAAPVAQQLVRVPADKLSDMTDSALQEYIHACAEQFLSAQRRYEETGCFTAIGDRDRWWQAECEALRERGSRPHIVLKLERERGLA